MKNVTVALDDETHRRARIRAAELGTSLSALVKDYLTGLVQGENAQEARDMQMKYSAPPLTTPHTANPNSISQNSANQNSNGPPWLVNGQWVYTKDGKPRQPGAMRGMIPLADDWDEWPEGFLDAMLGDETEAAKNWYK